MTHPGEKPSPENAEKVKKDLDEVGDKTVSELLASLREDVEALKNGHNALADKICSLEDIIASSSFKTLQVPKPQPATQTVEKKEEPKPNERRELSAEEIEAEVAAINWTVPEQGRPYTPAADHPRLVENIKGREKPYIVVKKQGKILYVLRTGAGSAASQLREARTRMALDFSILSRKTCPDCGGNFDMTYEYCPFCGSKLLLPERERKEF